MCLRLLYLQNPAGKPVWLESITAIPADSFDETFLDPERTDGTTDYARQCGINHFYVDPIDEGMHVSLILFTFSPLFPVVYFLQSPAIVNLHTLHLSTSTYKIDSKLEKAQG